jgi:hypothetical protein
LTPAGLGHVNHASWCDDVRRQHHDDDVRAVGWQTGSLAADNVRDFDRWGWEVIEP